jgi:hypothetical protein
MSGRAAAALAVVALLALCAPALRAQNTTLTVSGLPTTFPIPDGSHFGAVPGHIDDPTYTNYTVQANNWPAGQTHTETISILCSGACPASGTKPLATLQYKLASDANWHTLTTALVVVESFTLTSTAAQRSPSHSSTIQWRFLLNWTTDTPGVTGRFNVRLRLTQS